MGSDDDDAIVGLHGIGHELEMPSPGKAAQAVTCWLVTAPMSHPGWSQYLLGVVRLDEQVPGFPSPHRQFDGATHELMVMALDPEHGPYDPARMATLAEPGHDLPYLTPVNIVWQVIASDDEMRWLARAAVWSVTNGRLNPETIDAPTAIRASWHVQLANDLAWLRADPSSPTRKSDPLT